MTTAFVALVVGYLVGMLHGKRLSTPRIASADLYARQMNGPTSWGRVSIPLGTGTYAHGQMILVNTQYNAHPPVS